MDSIVSTAFGSTAVASFIASFVGAWLAAYFGLFRFYREKVWERKTAAYTAIFSALHEMDQFFNTHIEDLEMHSFSEQEQQKLTGAFEAARAELRRRLAAEVWLIPPKCRQRIDRMNREFAERQEGWQAYLLSARVNIARAVEDLTRDVRVDLKLDHNPWSFSSWFSR
jgi:hypothetical protein